jgi:hypothetical protein
VHKNPAIPQRSPDEKVVSCTHRSGNLKTASYVYHKASCSKYTHMMCFWRAWVTRAKKKWSRSESLPSSTIHTLTDSRYVGVRLTRFCLKFVPSCTRRFLQGALGDTQCTKRSQHYFAESEKESRVFLHCIPQLQICVTLVCLTTFSLRSISSVIQ